jgi:hypothetical protein
LEIKQTSKEKDYEKTKKNKGSGYEGQEYIEMRPETKLKASKSIQFLSSLLHY